MTLVLVAAIHTSSELRHDRKAAIVFQLPLPESSHGKLSTVSLLLQLVLLLLLLLLQLLPMQLLQLLLLQLLPMQLLQLLLLQLHPLLLLLLQLHPSAFLFFCLSFFPSCS